MGWRQSRRVSHGGPEETQQTRNHSGRAVSLTGLCSPAESGELQQVRLLPADPALLWFVVCGRGFTSFFHGASVVFFKE